MLKQASQLCSCFEFAIMPPIRRSRRDSRRVNTLASGAVNKEISGAANNVNANYENHGVQPANPTNSAAPDPAQAAVPAPGGMCCHRSSCSKSQELFRKQSTQRCSSFAQPYQVFNRTMLFKIRTYNPTSSIQLKILPQTSPA